MRLTSFGTLPVPGLFDQPRYHDDDEDDSGECGMRTGTENWSTRGKCPSATNDSVTQLLPFVLLSGHNEVIYGELLRSNTCLIS
jgi:hypothetical protein